MRSLRSSNVRVKPGLGVMQHRRRWDRLLVSAVLLRVSGLLGQLSRKLSLVTVLTNSHQTSLLLVRWSGRGRRSSR